MSTKSKTFTNLVLSTKSMTIMLKLVEMINKVATCTYPEKAIYIYIYANEEFFSS